MFLFDLLHIRWPSLFNFPFADVKMNLHSLRTYQLMAEQRGGKRKGVSQPYSKGYEVKFKFKYSERNSTEITLSSKKIGRRVKRVQNQRSCFITLDKLTNFLQESRLWVSHEPHFAVEKYISHRIKSHLFYL